MLKRGRLILARDEEERVEFEATVMSRTHDRRPHELRRDAWLLERTRERGLA